MFSQPLFLNPDRITVLFILTLHLSRQLYSPVNELQSLIPVKLALAFIDSAVSLMGCRHGVD